MRGMDYKLNDRFIKVSGPLLLLFLLVGVADAGPLEPVEGRLLKVTGGGVVLDAGPRDVIFKYAITLAAKQPSHPRWYLTMAYENPQDPNAPLIQNIEIAPNQVEIICQSDEVSGWENGREYLVSVRLYEDAGKKSEIDQLTQAIRFQNVNAVAYKVYDNQEIGVHVKYPGSWHVKISQTKDVRQILFSRESVDEPPGKYKVGMQIMQFHDVGQKIPWLTLSVPDKAADQWLNATLQGTPGENELVEARTAIVGGKQAYYAELLMRPDGGYPMKFIKLTIFYPDTFSELICEAPEEEFENVRAIFEVVISDKDLMF